jgi:microcystin-dependent protein
MADQFVGEIMMFGGGFVPTGWLPCDGRLLGATDPNYNVLFTLIGASYGGDGIATFAIPDMRGRAPLHHGQGPGGLTNRIVGAQGGSETVSLDMTQIPAHTHPVECTTNSGNQTTAAGGIWARQPSGVTAAYQSGAPDTPMSASAIGATGTAAGHENMQPYLTITYAIAYIGIYPA